MDPKTQQRAMELCALIEAELHSLSARSETRPPELARVVGYLDELHTLVGALDPPSAGSQVSHLGSAVWRVVIYVSLQLIKALVDSQKYTQRPLLGTTTIGDGTTNAWYGSQKTPWGERTVAKKARSSARGRSKLCVSSREWSSRPFCASSSPVSNASRYPTRALACHCSLVRYA